MSFTLNVVFRGLCLLVRHEVLREAYVLLPDCALPDSRLAPAGADTADKFTHVDDTKAQPHQAFLQADLANLVGVNGVPGGVSGLRASAPQIVHLLEGVELTIAPLTSLPPAGPAFNDIGEPGPAGAKLPEFEKFADDLHVRSDVVDHGQFPDVLAARVRLVNGKFSVVEPNKTWRVSSLLSPTKGPFTAVMGAGVQWSVPVEDAEEVVLTLVPKRDSAPPPFDVRLRPIDGEEQLTVTIANRCADNPLRWRGLNPTTLADDVDFKWLYRLFAEYPDPIKTRLKGAELPYPRLAAFRDRGGSGCTPGGTRAPYDPPSRAMRPGGSRSGRSGAG